MASKNENTDASDRRSCRFSSRKNKYLKKSGGSPFIWSVPDVVTINLGARMKEAGAGISPVSWENLYKTRSCAKTRVPSRRRLAFLLVED